MWITFIINACKTFALLIKSAKIAKADKIIKVPQQLRPEPRRVWDGVFSGSA
jgi:hypothetical protein